MNNKFLVSEIYKKPINTEIVLNGWVRFNRSSKSIGFLEVFDGSFLNGIQVVYKNSNKNFDELSSLSIWSGISLQGKIVQSKNKTNTIKKEIELIKIIKIWNSSENHPLGKKKHSLEFLRTIPHVRPKTFLFQSLMKVRSVLSKAVHDFFEEENFVYVSSPIITSNDAEGAGETFEIKVNNKDFWSNQATLGVSGQLHAEAYAQAFGRAYTFAPTFRAENSNTKRHAAEFWMIEPEVAFYDYHDAMNLAERQIKYVIEKSLKYCKEEIMLLNKYSNKNTIDLLFSILKSKQGFKKITYKDAIQVLNNTKELPILEFGDDISTEHERYLSEKIYKLPIFVYDYPKEIKSFYMYQNDDKKTARGFDLLVPLVGELLGGSQREEDYDKLIQNTKSKKIYIEDLKWYIDMRKEGYVTSSGYGLGFERLIMFITGIDNIRDTIPFPRTPGTLEF